MKKLLSVLSSTLQGGVRGGLLFVALLATTTLWGEDFSVGGIYYNYLDGNNVEVTYRGFTPTAYSSEYSGSVEIPETVSYNGITYSVTSIGDDAFVNCSYLTSITIPNSVTSIGVDAFFNCESLTSVTIPNSVTSIGWGAFYECSSLTSVTIGNSVTSIGDYAFYECSSLTSVTIGNTVDSIHNYAFYKCSSLTSVTIGNSVTSIGEGAFAKCESLTKTNYTGDIAGWCNIKFGDASANPMYYSDNFYINDQEIKDLVIPNTVDSIRNYAFEYCRSLTSITIPNSVTSIGGSAFEGCSSLTSITIPSSVTSIGNYAFDGCSKLKSVAIPNSVTSIGSSAFAWCESLTSVTIGNSVTNIGDRVFYYCESLTSITIPNSVTSIGDYAFYNCQSLTSLTIGDSVTTIGDEAFRNCSSLTPVTIPNSVTSIGESAFNCCESLTSITIPNSVTSIGDWAFYNCESLTSVTLNSNEIVSKKYTYDKNISDIFGSQVEEYVIGNSVKSIGENAFYDCIRITSVTLNSNEIVSKKYTYDKNISDIFGSQVEEYVIGNSVTSIGDYAFDDCSLLTSITIPESVTSIGESAFSGCESLTKTNYTGDIAGWCNIKFGGATSNPMCYSHNFYINDQEIKDLVIPTSVDSIHNYAFQYCRSLTSITIPNSVTSIGSSAFAWCESLTSVTIGNCVTSIGDEAFYICSSLTSVTIPNSVTSIGESAFSVCSSLTSITIPNSVTSVGVSAFAWCESLTSVTIGNSVTSIGDEAFHRCESITSVVWNAKNCTDFDGYEDPFGDIRSQIRSFTFGDSVVHVPANLCRDMENLTSLIIPESVTTIGNDAFDNCSSLISVTIGKNLTSLRDVFFYCNSITSVVWNAKKCADLEYSPFNGSVTSFIFGDSVEHIPANICWYEDDLTSIIIPKNVTSIGENAFGWCYSLDSIVWNAKNCADSPFGDICSQIRSFTFGDSVEHIPANLCRGMTNLTSLIIPESVMSIGESAFSVCSSLSSITIPNSVTSIGSRAFSGCSSVTSLTLENNLTAIGSFAFSSLNALTSVTQKAPSIEAYCQGQVSKLLYDSASLNDDAIRTIEINGEEVTDWVIPSSITKIEDYTFYNCPSITSVALPNTITSIGESAFENCTSITSVALSNTITSIGKSAFENCTSITAITIPNKVTRIGARAFSKCPITDIIIPNNVTNIGGSAFSNCDKLSSLILGESVDSIGGGAFYGCRKLYDIYCYAPEPPYAIASGWDPSFENFNVNLYVPCDNLKAFQMDPVFGTFKYIHCIDSEDVPADGVIITPGFTDVTITWPTDDDADNYIIVIEKDGEVVCTLTFNADGQLLNIAFAPGRDSNHPVQYAEQAGKGFRFTVTGLEEGTNYTYDVITKDKEDNQLSAYSGEFTTQSSTHTDLENINSLSSKTNCHKIIRDNQLVIIHDGKAYNAMGQEL